MKIDCPQCFSQQTYVKDVNGELISESLVLLFVHRCIGCKSEWRTEREAYINQKKTI
jgi:hypothetical protein